MRRFSPGAAPGWWVTIALVCWAVAVVALNAGGRARPASPPAAGQPPLQAQTQPPAAPGDYVGEDTCLGCHADQAAVYHSSPHGRAENPRSPRAKQGCESCHGPGKAHVDAGGDPKLIQNPAKMPPRDASDRCMTCHNRGAHAAWEGSAHDVRQVSCTTCHSVHHAKSAKGQLKARDQSTLCATCHRDKVAKADRSGHMPLREGKLECTSCHNPHGSQNNVRLLKAGTSVTEFCVTCHTDKRGPFLYEHAPVRENCTTCHDPHGSSNERMLVAKMPILCQRCHVHTRHPSTIYDNLVVNTSNRLYARSCVTCHANIHGSNHPSGATMLR